MNYYSPVKSVVGVDAMNTSLDICRQNGIHNSIKLIPTRPDESIVEILSRRLFDFVYLFSVFTHTPQDVTGLILRALYSISPPNGVVVCTIRTIEWLAMRRNVWPNTLLSNMEAGYTRQGYAFIPLNGDQGNIMESDYGDTIMTPSYFSALASEHGWNTAFIDRDLSEPFQICITLCK